MKGEKVIFVWNCPGTRQGGINWMDRSLTDAQMSTFLDRLVSEARRGSVQEIIWITPPDSSRLRKTRGKVHGPIRQAAKRDNFQLFDSREVTCYVVGRTGADGIHYNGEPSSPGPGGYKTIWIRSSRGVDGTENSVSYSGELGGWDVPPTPELYRVLLI